MSAPQDRSRRTAHGSALALGGVLFLAFFALDGALSASDAALRAFAGSTALAWPRAGVAWLVVAVAPAAALCCAVSPRWPAHVYLPPIAATVWFALGALPVPMAVAAGALEPLLCALQLGVAGIASALLLLALRRSGGLHGFSEARAALSFRRVVGFAAASVIAVPVVAVAYVALATASWIEFATDGFLDLGRDGVSVAERRYVRDDREVRLVAMMHIGELQTYAAIFDSFQGESTLVLEEGVSDREHRLANGLSYAKAARALGLDAQGSVSAYVEEARAEAEEEGDDDEPWPDVTVADVDVSDFSPGTIAFIDRAGAAWGAEHPLAALLDLWQHPPPAADVNRLFAELVGMRNQRVLDELRRGLQSHRRVIVPWGALHLPGIARAIEKDGFVRTEESRRLLVSWTRVLAALSR